LGGAIAEASLDTCRIPKVGPSLSRQKGNQGSEFTLLRYGSRRRVLSSICLGRAFKGASIQLGPRDEIESKIEIAKSDYITKEIFESYVGTVSIPDVKSNETLEGCHDKPAILCCDNFSGCCTEDILQNLTRHGVIIFTYRRHTSHIFQVLDAPLFAVLKRPAKNQRRNNELPAQLDHAMRVFRAYEQATTNTTVKASWVGTGF
jgi:hypothetical protein